MKKILSLMMLLVMLVAVGCGQKPQENTDAQQSESSQPVAMDSAKSTYFVDANWVKDNLDKVIVIDARPDKDYKEGHIPGAINATWQVFASMEGKPGDANWGTVLPKEKLAEVLGSLGIDGKKTVIVYTAIPGWGEDGRIVWMLRMAGINDSRMLDGGWGAWSGANNEQSKDAPGITPVTCIIAAMDEGLNATADWIKTNTASIKIVDARSTTEYEGATDYGEARGGHLPNAISIPFDSTFNQDGTLKSTEELKDIFTKAGLTPDDEIVTYCTKGIRSAHMALQLRMAGFTKARNYDASFYEWAGNPEMTVEK